MKVKIRKELKSKLTQIASMRRQTHTVFDGARCGCDARLPPGASWRVRFVLLLRRLLGGLRGRGGLAAVVHQTFVIDRADFLDLTSLMFDQHVVEPGADGADSRGHADPLRKLQVNARLPDGEEIGLVNGRPDDELRVAQGGPAVETTEIVETLDRRSGIIHVLLLQCLLAFVQWNAGARAKRQGKCDAQKPDGASHGEFLLNRYERTAL